MTLRRILILLVLLSAIGAGIWFLRGSDVATAYRTEPATRGDIARIITATGRINPEEVVTVGTQVSGAITHIYVKANETVKKDQLLAEIDKKLYKAQIDQSQSSMENAHFVMEQSARDLKRAETLQAKNYISRVDLEKAQQDYRNTKSSYIVAKAQYERDKANLDYTEIRSPIDGVVIQSQVSAGQTMAANFQAPEMFKIAKDLTRMVIDVGLSEADIGQVKVGQPVRFTVDAYPQRNFDGVVQSVNINPNTQQDITTYSVLVSVENKDRALLPGMTAYVSIVLSQEKDVLRIPAAALRFQPPVKRGNSVARLFGVSNHSPNIPFTNKDSDNTVYVLRNGQAVPVSITTGGSDDVNVAVTGGDLKEGDEVITGIAIPGG